MMIEPYNPKILKGLKVEYENKILGYGIGKSKKEAQSKAAYQACVTLKLIKEE